MNITPIKIGLLPLYVALYDTSSPELRPEVEAFYQEVAERLRALGFDVITNPLCCLKPQFEQALERFESHGAEAVVTLHLAYSPSLESAEPLAATQLPLVVLDTTPDFLFDATIDSGRIMNNHGIHGVQDMCNLLRRNGKPFAIYAGHIDHSDVLERLAAGVRAAAAWTRLSHSYVGMVGEPFGGMGDFCVSDDRLAALGVRVSHYPLDADDSALRAVSQEALDREFAADTLRMQIPPEISREQYDATERVGLAIRSWLEREGFTAFTMNFEAAGRYAAFPTMPFSEASKAMARGIGYAGEGDVLTAAFVGALLRSYPDTTFAEMFCPNWRGNSVFFSHMGEFNLNIAQGRPHMILKDFPFAPGFDPTCCMGCFRAGDACYANLAPTKDGFRLILAEGKVIQQAECIGSFANSVSGWFRPDVALPVFLEEFSRAGGTHHGALVYGASAKELAALALFGGMECLTIGG